MPRTASLQAPDVVYLSVRFMQYTHSRATGLRHVLAYAGPSLMPGGTPEAYQHIEPIVQAVAAQVQPSPVHLHCLVDSTAMDVFRGCLCY